MDSPAKAKNRKIIVGIDFGTTYSGIAWAETKRPDRRATITTWPISQNAREGESSDKVPTKLRYSGGKVQWGFSVPITAPAEEVKEWFKLDLDPSLRTEGSIGKNPMGADRKPEDLVTDYLSALGDHLMYILKEKLGEAVVASLPFEFVVTVPAIWSDLAKDKTRLACLNASGFGAVGNPVHLVSEPEAAAIYALQGLDPHGLKIGDTMVVVDAGGGTVDLISYRITALEPVVEIEEAVPGSGGLCGSTFLNYRFANFLRAKIGHLKGFDDEIMAEAMEVFEKKVKRYYTTQTEADESFMIPVGGLANNKSVGVKRGRFALKGADLKEIFEPVIAEVIKLVEGQVEASKSAAQAILLVGGFGASNYLKERLRQTFKEDVRVLQPPNSWQAIVQGAVLKGLAITNSGKQSGIVVKGRRARCHYGVELYYIYDEEKHAELADKRYWHARKGAWCVDLMKWFIRRGDVISENKPYYVDFNQWRSVAEGKCRDGSLTVYVDQTQRPAPLARDASIRQLCEVKADLSKVPDSKIQRQRGRDRHMYYKLTSKIEVIFLSASTAHALWVDGKKYDTLTCEYV